jgi:hypothetical protein
MPTFTEPCDPAAIEALARNAWGEPNERLSSADEKRFGKNGSKSIKPRLGGVVRPRSRRGRALPRPLQTCERHLSRKRLGQVRLPDPGRDAARSREPHGMVGLSRCTRIRGGSRGAVPTAGADKTFRQCRPEGDRWTWKMGGLQLPLYRLPSLLHTPAGSLVYITEGEKHADRLREWGLIATTNAGGAGKFRDHHARALVGHTVVVLGDNDAAGRKHVAATLGALKQAAVTAYALDLPYLPDKGDVMDWIADGGTKEDLAALTAEIIALRPPGSSETWQPIRA